VAEDVAQQIADGYAIEGAALELGALVLDGTAHPQARIRMPLSMLNRHGLVAGATGTGKTKTMQLMAEQLSTAGVPVFLADIKGDVSGMAAPGQDSDRIRTRATDTGSQWSPETQPAEQPAEPVGAPTPERTSTPRPAKKEEGLLDNPAVRSFARAAGTAAGREIMRSVFGTARRRR
jgi:hypothetical protein